MKYNVNLVRDIRLKEKKEEARRSRLFLFTVACFSVLGLSVIGSAVQILLMEKGLSNERDELAKIEAQYRKYQATKMFIDKTDVELLDRLQNGRIFWTRKLAAMAKHLPENYWITKFTYDGSAFRSSGYGYITGKQEQLMVLNSYFNRLRLDSTYNDVFKGTNFDATTRQDEKGRWRVGFEFSSEKQKRLP